MSDLKVLIIDDLRMSKEPGATHAVNAKDGIRFLETQDWDYILLDHDLGWDMEKNQAATIWPVIDYICEHPERFRDKMIDVISSNPAGAQYMKNALEGALGIDVPIWTEARKREAFDYRDWEELEGY